MEVLAFIFIFQKVVSLWPPSQKWHHKQTKIIFHNTKFTCCDRKYPIELTNIKLAGILWSGQILLETKIRAIWQGKEPIKEWVSFFLGSWGMNRSVGQTNRVNREAVLVRFVCSALRFIPHEPRKIRHSFLIFTMFPTRTLPKILR